MIETFTYYLIFIIIYSPNTGNYYDIFISGCSGMEGGFRLLSSPKSVATYTVNILYKHCKRNCYIERSAFKCENLSKIDYHNFYIYFIH